MNNTSRMQVGAVSSILLHLVMVLLISLCGIFSVPAIDNQIVEIAITGGEGGGGGGGGNNELIERANSGAVPANNTPTVTEKNIATDNIAEINKMGEDLPSNDQQYNAPDTSEQNSTNSRQNTENNRDLGSGKGTGTGSGSGSGSGSGTGSGSGSGSGSGTGSGTGSGSGSGHGAGRGEGNNVGLAREAAVPPRLVRQHQPEYPEEARKNGIVGTVLVKIVVAKDGSVEQSTVGEASGASSLDNAAIRAVKGWRFTPAQDKFGRAVRCYTYIPITFSLK